MRNQRISTCSLRNKHRSKAKLGRFVAPKALPWPALISRLALKLRVNRYAAASGRENGYHRLWIAGPMISTHDGLQARCRRPIDCRTTSAPKHQTTKGQEKRIRGQLWLQPLASVHSDSTDTQRSQTISDSRPLPCRLLATSRCQEYNIVQPML